MIAALRSRAVDLVAGAVAAVRGTSRHRGDAVVLAYHNIVPDDFEPAGDRSLHLPLHRFRAQLDALAEDFDIVSLDAALEDAPPSRRPRVAITFDDAYHGAVTLGFAELQRRGLPATVFVAPGLLGVQTVWWDALAAEWLDGRDPALRDACLATGAVLEDARALAEARGRAWIAAPAELAIATEQVLVARLYDGLTVGAHTWRHVNLAAWNPAWSEPELVEPLAWLRARFGSAVRPWLALPFGLDSDSAIQAAMTRGYERVFFVSGGWRRGVASGGLEPRFNVPSGLTVPRLRMRLGAPDPRLRGE